jgi:hypothetical protein
MAPLRVNTRRSGGRFQAALCVSAFLGALALPGGQGVMAAIYFDTENPPRITLTIGQFGLTNPQTAQGSIGTVLADEIEPLGIVDIDPSLFVPSSIGGSVAADGTITVPLAFSYDDYVWRLRITTKNECDNFRLTTVTDTYDFEIPAGTNSGRLPKTTAPTSQQLKVTLVPVPGLVREYETTKLCYVYRKLNLKIDLSSIRYSGRYRARPSFDSTVTYTYP